VVGTTVTDSCDIAVVGAGPAGSVAAVSLARAGRRVVLLDKATFPRRKVCGCCLNGHALSALVAAGLGELPEKLGAVPLNRVTLAASGRTANLKLPSGMALSREAMDAALVREAEAAGVVVRTGVKVKLGELDADGWTLFAAADTLRARVVIDATGLNGQLTNTDIAVSVESRIGAGTVIAAPGAYPAGVIHMATGGGGYVGLVRIEDGRLDVAAAFDPAFVKANGGLGEAAEGVVKASGLPPLPELRDADWKGTPPLTRTPRAVAGPRWFAVGDATGYVEPFTGEGMAWALAAAVAVTPLAIRAADGWTEQHAREWAATHRRVVRRRQGVCKLAARVLRSGTLCSWVVRGLSAIPAVATPVVKLLNHPMPRSAARLAAPTSRVN
jgi:flavin-dependent dehydrogenase